MSMYAVDILKWCWLVFLSGCLSSALAEECGSQSNYALLEARIDALEALAQDALLSDDSDQHSARSHGLMHRNSKTHVDRYIVAREQKTWSSMSKFLVAVDGLPRVTSTYIQSETTFGGVPHHFLLGGDNGMLHVHSLSGSLILDYETEGASPITAIVEKRKRSNSTHVVTGHADGCIRWHIMDYSMTAKASKKSSIRQLDNSTYCPDAAHSGSSQDSIKLLSIGRVHQKNQKLAVVAVTEGNDVVMLRESGRKPVLLASNRTIYHVHFENRQVRMMTEHGFSHAMLLSSNTTVKALKCSNLNDTRLIAAAPDPIIGTRAFGISEDGELVSFSLPGEQRVISCRVRFRKGNYSVKHDASMSLLHDAILVADSENFHVFNGSGRSVDLQASMVQEELAALRRKIGVPTKSALISAPAMSSTANYVVLQLTDSIVAVYHRPNPSTGGSINIDWLKWARPIMLVGALAFGAFQFSRKRSSGYSSKIQHAAEMRMRSRMFEKARIASSHAQ